MRRLTVFVLATAFSVGVCSIGAAQDAKVASGEKLFADQKCTLCHSVAGKGNKKGPLDGFGSKLSADEIRQWLTNPKEMRAKAKATRLPEMISFAKLPKDDLDALVAYVSSLKKS